MVRDFCELTSHATSAFNGPKMASKQHARSPGSSLPIGWIDNVEINITITANVPLFMKQIHAKSPLFRASQLKRKKKKRKDEFTNSVKKSITDFQMGNNEVTG